MGAPARRGDPSSMARGFTLLELVVAVSLAAFVLGAGLPAARRSVDRMAVVGAREAMVGMIVRARSEAVTWGGARVVLDASAGTVRVETSSGVVDALDLGAAFRVRLDLGGSRTEAHLTFDGLGIGRIASRSVQVTRGSAAAGIVVSSYGRVTRR